MNPSLIQNIYLFYSASEHGLVHNLILVFESPQTQLSPTLSFVNDLALMSEICPYA